MLCKADPTCPADHPSDASYILLFSRTSRTPLGKEFQRFPTSNADGQSHQLVAWTDLRTYSSSRTTSHTGGTLENIGTTSDSLAILYGILCHWKNSFPLVILPLFPTISHSAGSWPCCLHTYRGATVMVAYIPIAVGYTSFITNRRLLTIYQCQLYIFIILLLVLYSMLVDRIPITIGYYILVNYIILYHVISPSHLYYSCWNHFKLMIVPYNPQLGFSLTFTPMICVMMITASSLTHCCLA